MMRLHTQACRWVIAAVVCALTLAAVTLAQPAGTSRLHGTVTDQTGGVVIAAKLTLVSESGQTWFASTNEKGQYVFEKLPAGRHTLVVTYEGFEDFTTPVDLRADSSKGVDARLRVAIAVSASVEAGTGNELGLSADPRNSLSAVVLTARDIARLPDDPQRMLMRLLELAGSTGRPEDVALLVDGFREYKRLPPKDTIEMIRINSNPFSAEFAQPGLDRIEIVTKPGSDTYHGEIRVQGGDSKLDARNPIVTTKPDTRTRNYNGWLQGPIVKGRLDFMAYAGQWQQDESAIINAIVLDPSAAATQPFATGVTVPARINSFQFGMNIRPFANQRINFTLTRNEEKRRNQGLEGGFDLPERAFDRTATDEVGRMLWTTVGSHAVNDVRVEVTRNRSGTNPLLSTPAILVFDGFFAGGNQTVGTSSSSITTQASNTLTLQRGRHTLKGGVVFESVNQDSTDRTGFNGAFLFGTDIERDAAGNGVLNEAGLTTLISPIENYRRTVLGLPGYAPSEFRITSGNPAVGVDQWSVGWFALDDWSVSNRLSLSYGLRQDLQNNVSQKLMIEPRAALSWLVDSNGKNAIKLGGGVFSGRVDPGITLDTRKANGIDRQQLIFLRPSGFPAIPTSLDQATAAQSAVYTKASDLRMPYAVIGTISYERQLPWNLFAVAQYTHTQGENLLRLRNINAPQPGVAGGTASASTSAPTSASTSTSPILQFESTGRSEQRQMMVGLRGHIKKELTFYGNYTFGKKESDTDTAYTTPADSYNLALDYGAAADDQRHTFVAGATLEFKKGLLITPSVSVASGRPFNITTGADNNGDTLFSDRPAFAMPGDAAAIVTPYGLLDPTPSFGDAIIPRNFGREPWQTSVNLSISQTFPGNVILGIDADNLLNNKRLVRSNGVLISPTFGLPNLALNGRRLLFSLRYGF